MWQTKLTIGLEGFSLTKDLTHWINDGLMAVFFLVVGLEIKREILVGELSSPRRAALGRIRDLEKFDAAVAWVLEHRPKTKEAVARIRLFRTGKRRSPNARELAKEIFRTVNGYAIRYPELTREQELEALRLATETYEWTNRDHIAP